jgi:hypothetical protein
MVVDRSDHGEYKDGETFRPASSFGHSIATLRYLAAHGHAGRRSPRGIAECGHVTAAKREQLHGRIVARKWQFDVSFRATHYKSLKRRIVNSDYVTSLAN